MGFILYFYVKLNKLWFVLYNLICMLYIDFKECKWEEIFMLCVIVNEF